MREALSQLAAAEVPELLAEARVAARARARSLIEDALVDEFLRAAVDDSDAEREPAATAAEPPPQPDTTPPSTDTEPREHEAAPEAAPTAEAWWAYCVITAAEREAAPVGFPGVEPSGAVELIQQGGLAAVVSPVPVREFSDERLREHLNDVVWVERVARAHETVLERTLEQATILPLRLCTLYKDREGVSRMLREQEPTLHEALESLDGRREWGAKLFVDDERLAAAAAADTGTAAAVGGSSGTAYMARRQHEREASERARELGDHAAHEVHARLERVAEDARANPLQRPDAHGRDGRMVLNGAYLIEREREGEFEQEVASLLEQWEASGFELELTGPWPPYNFVSTSTLVMP